MLSLIAAIAQNNCIGKDNKLPWHLPEDLQHFKELTTGKIVLMGRKTLESILGYLGKPLPQRKNIVLTTQPHYQAPEGVAIYGSIEAVLTAYPTADIMVIGGAKVYADTIGRAQKLYITQVNQVVAGEAFFPVIDKTIWKEDEREDHTGFSFVTYNRL